MSSTGTLIAAFVWGNSPVTPEYIVKSGVNYRLVTDPRGSVRLVVNSSNGTVAQRLDYDEWGKVTYDSNPGFQPFGFAGGIYDSQTGLVQFGARHYDGNVGRWLSRDPIWFNGGDTNLFGYVLNDPINFLDPSGLLTGSDLAFCGGVGFGFGVGVGLGIGLFGKAPGLLPIAGVFVGGGAGFLIGIHYAISNGRCGSPNNNSGNGNSNGNGGSKGGATSGTYTNISQPNFNDDLC